MSPALSNAGDHPPLSWSSVKERRLVGEVNVEQQRERDVGVPEKRMGRDPQNSYGMLGCVSCRRTLRPLPIPSFTGKGPDILRGAETCPGSYRKLVASVKLEPRSPGCKFTSISQNP